MGGGPSNKNANALYEKDAGNLIKWVDLNDKEMVKKVYISRMLLFQISSRA